MPKPRDPVVSVIQYFEHAELPLAQQALSMAQAIVRNRLPKKAPGTAPSRSKKRAGRQEVEPPLPLN